MKPFVRSQWSKTVLVCRKCSKKVDGGFGPRDERLAKALRRHLGTRKGRKAAVGIVEVDCLGICPKQAVVVVDGDRAGEWLLVRPGAPIDALAVQLGLAEDGARPV
ncbi:(2Fe-2S) ferredoxin domain-containing protein [Sphingomonas sp. 1P06PA]|uniref:(2Fe-2S) ferredoxin domain-containing protein n=1 Tax=Sphingomonas sp. 1P06PA TaxID=554121 RepID=UPI0039A633C8